jgi:hypothetical protein
MLTQRGDNHYSPAGTVSQPDSPGIRGGGSRLTWEMAVSGRDCETLSLRAAPSDRGLLPNRATVAEIIHFLLARLALPATSLIVCLSQVNNQAHLSVQRHLIRVPMRIYAAVRALVVMFAVKGTRAGPAGPADHGTTI